MALQNPNNHIDTILNVDMLIESCIDMLEQGIAFRPQKITNTTSAPRQSDGQDIVAETYADYGKSKQSKSPTNTMQTNDILDDIANEIAVCEQCNLCKERTYTVSGEGVDNPLVLVVGEAPGAEENKQGKPFVGPSGAYLDKWLDSIGLSRYKNVYITNTVKCRPPNNRNPLPEEMESCNHFLKRQIHILQPRLILALGKVAGIMLSGMEGVRIDALRKQIFEYEGIPLYITYHPSAVLRNPDGLRALVWNDLQKIQGALQV